MREILRRGKRPTVAIATAAIVAVVIGSIGGCSFGWLKGGPAAGGAKDTGGSIGRYMDEQAEELSRIEGANTGRAGDEIRITWPSAALFDFDSAMLTFESQPAIRRMADVFARFPETDIVIAGHTDDEGPADHNRKLSERRALSLRDYLIDLGVAPSRLRAEGHGDLLPVASNDTEEGRRSNRRVEIVIRPGAALGAPSPLTNEQTKAPAAE